jgi:hypothetical protein
LRASRAILYGTLVVGTLDALDAIVFFGLRSGATPVRIFQGIASGWLGRASSSYGMASVALGVATHYFIAFGIVTTYFVVSRRMRVLTQHPIRCGIVYGLIAYFVMNRVVIPLSAIGSASWPVLPVLANGLLIHAFGIGIPSAVFATLSSADRGVFSRETAGSSRQE